MTPSKSKPAAKEFPLLLSEARNGSRDALGELLDMSRHDLLAHVRCPAKLQAKINDLDLVQETFLKALHHFADFRGSTYTEWLAWLRAILDRIRISALRRFRQPKRDIEQEQPLDLVPLMLKDAFAAPQSADPLMDAENGLLFFILSGLYPDKYRVIIQLRMQEQLSFAEIGTRLACSEEAARKLWTRVGRMIYQDFVRFNDFETVACA